MQKKSSRDTPPLHYRFEHVQSSPPPLSSHHHHTTIENRRDTRDFKTPQIIDGLTNILSGWGWLTPEREGRSQSFSTASHQQNTTMGSDETDQMQKTTTNDKTGGISQTSFADRYGKFSRVIHYDDSNTVQLYEKKVPASEQINSLARSQSRTQTMLRRASISNKIKELYAVKVFRRAQTSLLPLTGSLHDQSRTISLSHPNVLAIIDILYNTQTNLCIVMPYCAGGNLQSFLSQTRDQKEQVSTEELNCLAIQIMRAVAFLHENNVVHGDLKPDHILLTAQGAVKVGGFGQGEDAIRELAQLLHGGNSTASSSAHRRSSSSASNYQPKLCIRRNVSESSGPYLPPERYSDRRGSRRQSLAPQNVSDRRAADVWACGIIYMLLRSGKLLWHSTRKDNPDKAFENYLRSRLEEDGYHPIQVLENVSNISC